MKLQHERRGARCLASIALSVVMVLSLLPTVSLAETLGEDGVASSVGATGSESTGASSTASLDTGTSDQEVPSAVAAGEAAPADDAAQSGDQPAEAPEASATAPVRAPQTSAEVWVNATAGSDDNSGASDSPVKTLTKALELVADGGTIHTTGSFTLASDLVIDKSVTFTGTGNFLTVASGARLSAPGKTVTMTGYGTALTIAAGAELNDGNYVLDGNTVGFVLKGTIKGSSRDALKVSAIGTNVSPFTGVGTALENCTVVVQATSETGEQYGRLTMTNASLTTRGVWYYFDPSGGQGGIHLDHSDFYAYKATGSSNYKQVMAILGSSELRNGSTLNADGSRVTLSEKLTVDDSKVVIKNSSAGGLNINYKPGEAVFTNSTLETTNMRWRPSYGTGQSDGPCYLTFQGSSVVNTDAKDKTADDGGANRGTGSTYVVTGGSYLVAYDPSFNYDVTTPTNGAANGDEWLSLFTLADPSVSSLSPINSNGDAYDYPVANASRDGQKHVWTPAAKVVFKLNNGNATFADGTTGNKTASTIRGYAFDDVTGNMQPGDPTDSNGIGFLGWYYRDASGAEHEFDWSAKQTQTGTLEVYAKWEAKTVIYHNGSGQDYIQTLDAADSSATTLSFDEIVAKSAGFAVAGKTFDRWTTSPDGSGDAIAAGSTLSFANGVTQVDLYAQYTNEEYRVAFSANGGTFSDTSVFKANPDVFAIEKDSMDGEVAVLRQTALYGQKLHDLLGGVSHNDLTPTKAAVSRPGYLLGSGTYWYKAADATGDSLRFDDYKLFGRIPVRGANPEMTADTIYYLKWKVDPSVPATEADLMLDSDMWADSKDKTIEVKKVYADGSGREFSLTGAVDVASIKAQMASIESVFPDDAATPENTSLSSLSSSFAATIALPEGVVVPQNPKIDVTGLGRCFELTSARVDGQNVIVTFGLKGGIENYKQLKDAVDSTGGSDSQAVVAQRRAPAAPTNQLTVTVNGLTVDADKVSNGQELTATGTVSGTFGAVAKNSAGTLHRFAFTWTGDQEDGSKDVKATDDSTIQQTLRVVKPAEAILPADITIGDDTEHASVYETLQGSRLDFTGTIDSDVVKEQMRGVESQFPGTTDFTGVRLSEVSSSFVATFTIPEGMTFPGDLDAQKVTTDGFADTFAVSDVRAEGQTMTVTMTLRDGIENYQQLKDAVDALGKTMRITVPGVTVNDDVAVNKNLTVTGTVTGSFSAVATSAAGTEKDFSFKWTGEQTPEGKDATAAADNNAIRFTVRVPSTIDDTLYGDILIGEDTEHEAVFSAKRSDTLTFTGALDVDSIKQQMEGIESRYPNTPHDAIGISDADCTFTATFTVPDGMILPALLSASDIATRDFGGFEVKDVKVDGQTVTVTMGLKGDIENYQQLEDAVDAAGGTSGWMRLDLPGVTMRGDVAVGQQLTVVGTIGGRFRAIATSPAGTRKAFSFKWDGVQWADGKDAVATDDETIQFTLKVVGEDVPPANPGDPVDPSAPQATTAVTKVRGPIAKIPQTGDAAVLGAFAFVIAFAGAAVVGAGTVLRRRRQ